jgi:hypothetical protein
VPHRSRVSSGRKHRVAVPHAVSASEHALPDMAFQIRKTLCGRGTSTSESHLQFAFEFIEEVPVRVLRDELLWARLDQARLVHAQRVEEERVLRGILPPNIIADLARCL